MAEPLVRRTLKRSFKSRPQVAAGVASLVLHAALLFLLRPEEAAKELKPTPSLIELSFSESESPSSPSRTSSASPGPSAPKAPGSSSAQTNFGLRSADERRAVWSRAARTGDLAVSDELAAANSAPADPWQSVEAAGHGYSSAVQYGNAMGLQQTLESLHFFQALHRRIDGHLVFPDDFARHRIEGQVRIEAELTQDGRLLRFTSFNSEHRVLPAYLMALLTQVLEKPLRPQEHAPNPRVHVAFDFDFRTRLRGMPENPAPSGAQKNHLRFARDAIVPSQLEDKIHEVFTHYIPPVIPIPGGVYIDFVLAYEYVNNLIEGAPTESDARQARIEDLHERLRSTLRQSRERGPSESPTPQPES